jgi:ribosomal protein S12 methylthiotransferase
LERLKNWRSIVPDIAVRSSFVVGFPGETEEDFQYLLDWLEEAQLDRVGAFKFEPVSGAAANALPDPVPEEVKQDRYERVMALSARISAEKLAAKVGKTIEVLIDRVDEVPAQGEGADRGHFDAPHPQHHHDIGATGRSKADAPEIDGEVHLRDAGDLSPGDIVLVNVEDSDEHDLYGVPETA